MSKLATKLIPLCPFIADTLTVSVMSLRYEQYEDVVFTLRFHGKRLGTAVLELAVDTADPVCAELQSFPCMSKRDQQRARRNIAERLLLEVRLDKTRTHALRPGEDWESEPMAYDPDKMDYSFLDPDPEEDAPDMLPERDWKMSVNQMKNGSLFQSLSSVKRCVGLNSTFSHPLGGSLSPVC